MMVELLEVFLPLRFRLPIVDSLYGDKGDRGLVLMDVLLVVDGRAKEYTWESVLEFEG